MTPDINCYRVGAAPDLHATAVPHIPEQALSSKPTVEPWRMV